MRLSEREFIVSAEVMFILRQGLYMTKYHLDPASLKDVYALTGVELDDFARLMAQIDDLSKQRGRFPRVNDVRREEVAIRRSDGEFIVSAEELFVLRQGLLITTHYLDPVFREDLHALTGLDHEDFAGLMQQIDDLS